MNRYKNDGYDDFGDDCYGEDVYADIPLCRRDKPATNRDVIIEGSGDDDTVRRQLNVHACRKTYDFGMNVNSGGGDDDDVDDVEDDNSSVAAVDEVKENAVETTTNPYWIDYENVEDRILDDVDKESFQSDDDDGDDDDEVEEDLLEDDNDESDDEEEKEALESGGESNLECDEEEEEEEECYHPSNYYINNERHYINDKISITKQSMIGGPITSVFILQRQHQQQQQCSNNNSITQNDVLYGQGPYLHRVPHESWIQQQRQRQDVAPTTTQPSKSDTTELESTNEERLLLVFPNGGTIHGIREYGYDDRTSTHVMLVFGGRQLALVGLQLQQQRRRRKQSHQIQMHRIVLLDSNSNTNTNYNNSIYIDTNNHTGHKDAMEESVDISQDEDEQLYQQFKIEVAKSHDQTYMEEAVRKHQTQIQKSSQIKYHTTMEDWIWDCRIVSVSTSSTIPFSSADEENCRDAMSVEKLDDDDDNCMNGERYSASDDEEEDENDDDMKSEDEEDEIKGHDAMIVVGLAHQQIEICCMQILYATMTEDGSIDKSANVGVSWKRLQSIKNNTIPKCIAYSMSIWIPPAFSSNSKCVGPTVMVASGTVSNTICVWPFVLGALPTTTSRTMPSCVSLNGHEGVIHAVRFHASGEYLISTSDDRTVRLWEKRIETEENHILPQWNLKWTAYGHTARGWDVAFCDLSNNTAMSCSTSRKLDATVVLSTGEDGTLRIWDAMNGHALAVLRGHSCQCIWRVAAIESNQIKNPINIKCSGFAVTTGNDGTIAFYDIRNSIPSLWWDQKQQHQKKEDHDLLPMNAKPPEAFRKSMFVVPNDYCVKSVVVEVPVDSQVNSAKTATTASGPTTKRKKKDVRQTVIGMKFTKYRCRRVHNDKTDDGNGIGVIVATRSGSMWDLDVHSGVWTELEPWNHTHHSTRTNGNDEPLADGNCMCLHPALPIVAIGTASGDVILSEMAIRDAISSVPESRTKKPKHYLKVLPAHEHYKSRQRKNFDLPSAKHYRSVQSMKWILPNILVSFHINTIIIWYFPKLRKTEDIDTTSFLCTTLKEYTILPLRTNVKGLAISAALNVGQTKLVVGDTRGNLSLFHISAEIIEEEYRYGDGESDPEHDTDLRPMSTCRDCHQKEHVTDIIWQDWKTVVSVGNDGKICKCTIDSANQFVKLLSIPVGSFTGISKIWKLTTNNQPNFVVGGYYGNNFATVDVSNGYEFFRVDTGGRQRAIDVWMDSDLCDESKLPHSALIATCANRDDGSNEIQLHDRSNGVKNITPFQDTLITHSRGIPLHGESIFDVHIFHIDENRRSFGILTGSEDCSARLTIYRCDKALASTTLPPQVSSIRAVCSCRFDISSTLVVIGGKNSVELFVVDDIDDTMVDRVAIRYLGSGSPVEKLSIDHRINCVRAFMLKKDCDSVDEEEEDKDAPIIFVVSGDSNGSCYEYQFSKSFNASGKVIYKDERPILCLDIIRSSSHYLLFVGGTAGDVAMIYMTLPVDPYEDWDPKLCLLLHLHSTGTNSIAARILNDSHYHHSGRDVRIISCGDDQAITCTDVTIETYGRKKATTAQFKVSDAALSALKGIQFITTNLVVATGYDQKISVWRCIDEKSLTKVHECATDVGDVNCFSACVIGGTNICSHLLVVGGAGIEVLKLQIKLPKL